MPTTDHEPTSDYETESTMRTEPETTEVIFIRELMSHRESDHVHEPSPMSIEVDILVEYEGMECKRLSCTRFIHY